jgi:acyl carrier protein
MTREEFLAELDEILELPAGTVKGSEKLEDLEQWNSTAMIGFIALADTNNGTRISPRQIVNCTTVEDLLKLAKADGSSD